MWNITVPSPLAFVRLSVMLACLSHHSVSLASLCFSILVFTSFWICVFGFYCLMVLEAFLLLGSASLCPLSYIWDLLHQNIISWMGQIVVSQHYYFNTMDGLYQEIKKVNLWQSSLVHWKTNCGYYLGYCHQFASSHQEQLGLHWGI